MFRSLRGERSQDKERINMDQVQKTQGPSPSWSNPFPRGNNSQSQSPSGRGVGHNTSVQSHYLKTSHLNLLASFGLSSEDLEKLSHYPDDQLTPENIPLLLQAIRKPKPTPKVPTVNSKSTRKGNFSLSSEELEKLSHYPDDQQTPENIPFLSQDIQKPKLAPKVPTVSSKSTGKGKLSLSSEELEKLSHYPDDQLTPENIPLLLQAIRKPKLAPKVPTVNSKSTGKGNFSLSSEELEKLSHYPDDQLTPENIPLLLQAMRKPKLVPKEPSVPPKSTEKETLSHAEGHSPLVTKNVIDYGHKSKYGCNQGPLEGQASSTAAYESMEGFLAQQPASVPAAPSSLISNPKNPGKELVRQLGSQTNTPNPQAFPPVDPAPKVPSADLRVPAPIPPSRSQVVPSVRQPAMPPVVLPIIKPAMSERPPPFAPEVVETVRRHDRYEYTCRDDPPNRPCQATDGQKHFRKEAEEPIKSPFGVVKASWLPSFSHTDKSKTSKLPNVSQMNDYNAVTPRIFPHVCSLCREDCKDKMDWMQHQNTLLHIENCRWLLRKHPEWTPEAAFSPQRCKDDRQERHQSRQRSASPSPKRSRRSSSSHASHRTRSRSRSPRCKDDRQERHQSRQRSASPSPKRSRRSSSSHASHRTRSRSRSPRRKNDRQERHQSRQRSASRSPKRSRHSRSSHARHRTRSRSRSPRYHRTSRPRSRSPRRLPSPRHRSRSPRQSLNSSGCSRSSSSKERGSGNSTRSAEGRHAMVPCSKKSYEGERKQTPSSSDCQKKGCEGLERPKEDTPCQNLSVDKTENQEQTHKELVPEQPSHGAAERLTLASLTEKSVLQAIAQLQGEGAAEGRPHQGKSSAELAAGVVDASTVSSELVSMIQRVATQVITAVLDSKEVSTARASTSRRDPTRQKLNCVSRKAKSQSVGSRSLQHRSSEIKKAAVKRAVGLDPQEGAAKSAKAKCKSLGRPCPKKGTSFSSKAKKKEEVGLCPKKGGTKKKPEAGACPKKRTSLCSKAKNKRVVTGPCIQLGVAAIGKEENECVVDQSPERGIASSDGAANDSGRGLAPHQATAESGKAEDQDVASCSLTEATAGNGEAESLRVADPCPSRGTAVSCDTENTFLAGLSSQEDIGPNSQAGSQDRALGLVPGNISPCSASPGQVSKPRAHIYGGCLVVSAQNRASSTTVGLQLGLEESVVLEWHGQENLTWTQLVPTIQNLAAQGQAPDVFIIHLERDILSVVKQVLSLLKGLLPQAQVIWSEMIPQRNGHGGEGGGQWEKTNTSVGQLVQSCGGAVIKHPRISSEDPELYTDKANLSDAGLDIFLEDIKNGILAHVLQSGRAAGDGLSRGMISPPPASPAAPAGLGSVSQEVAAQAEEAVSSSEEASSMRTNTGEAALSSQAVSSKAEHSAVASPSPQPGASGTCVAENQVVDQKQVARSFPLCPGFPGQAAKVRIWICGPTVVTSARERAATSSIGCQLGLEESVVLEWHGRENMKWEELLPFLQNLATQSQPPDVLIVHLGEDDLAYALEIGLLCKVKKQFFLLTKSFAAVKVFWSEMMPWGAWHGGERDMKRAQVNHTLGQCIKLYGGGVIKHPRTSPEDPELYIDESNLSDAGLDIFLEDIKNGIHAHVLQSSKAGGGRHNRRMKVPPPASQAAPPGVALVSQEVATREDEVVSSSEEASNKRTNRGQAAVSPQAMNAKAENSGVASPSPRSGASGSCKTVKQDMEQELVDGSISPCPVTCEQVTKPRVWICGDSLVVSAQKWDLQKRLAGERDWLKQHVVVEWHGQEGLTWSQLVPTLQRLAAQHQAPDVLILHLGEKDLLSTPWQMLFRIIKVEVVFLKNIFPKVKLIWSEMLLQNTGPDACEAEKVLQKVNFAVGELISNFGGAVIKHAGTSNSFPVLKVRGGGLSHVGLDIFLDDLKNGIRAHVLQSSGAAIEGLKEDWPLFPFAPLAAPAGFGSVSQEVAIQGDRAELFSKEAPQMCRNTGEAAVSSQPASGVPKKMQTVRQQFILGSFQFCSATPAGLGSESQEVAVRWDQVVSFSEEASQMQRNTGETAVSSQPASCVPKKKKMQKVERNLTFGISHFHSGSVGHSSKPRVWICGDSVVVSAQKRVSCKEGGSPLHLEQRVTLEWHGQDNLNWIQLLPFLQNLVTCRQAPNALIIHLGEKGFARAVKYNFVDRVQREFFLLMKIFPQVRVIWSEVIPQGILSGKEGYDTWKRINKVMRLSIKSHGGAVIEHPRISSRMCAGKASLSPSGLDIFLEDIKNGILAHVPHFSKPAGGGLKESMISPPPASPAAPAGLGSVSQEVATEAEEVVSSSEEAACMQTNTGEAAPGSQPVRNKAANSGVASPSPRPGTSGTCKTETQDVEQRLVLGSVPPCPGSPGPLSKRRIWICGHAMVALAQERAASSSTGSQLGLEKSVVLEWHGWEGLMWVELIPLLQDLATYHPAPDVLIIHLGENDLMYTLSVNFLIKKIKNELLLLRDLFPNVQLIWSDMIPWGSMPGMSRAADKRHALKQVNIFVGDFVKHYGYAVIKHPRISSEDPELYTNRANLSIAGLDIFLKDIKNGILAHVLQSSRAAGGGLSKGMIPPPPASPAAPADLGSVSQEVAAQAEEAVSSSEEASCMQTNTGEAALSSQPMSSKAENSTVASPSPQPGASGSCTAENQVVGQKQVAGIFPPCPGEVSVSPQPKMSGSCKAEKQDVEQEMIDESVSPCPGEAALSSCPMSIKAENPSMASPSPQPGTPESCKAEKQDVEQELVDGSVSPCSGEPALSSWPMSIKAENPSMASPSPQPGTPESCKAEKQDVEQELVDGSVPPCPGEAAVSPQPLSRKAENPGMASPSPQPGTPESCKAEKQDVEQELVDRSVSPCSGEAALSPEPLSRKAENPGGASPSPQPGTPESCKAEKQDVEQELVDGSVSPCPGERALSSWPMSIKAENPGVASPSPQPGTPESCKAEKQDVEQELVDGSVSPCPGERALSSWPMSIKAENPGVASPSPQPGTPESCKAEKQDVEQELVDGSVSPCPGEPALSSWPMSIKAENPGVASPSPQPGMSESCKAEKQDVEQELVDGSVPPCPGEAALSSCPMSIKAENPSMASPSPQPGMSESCKAEKQDVEQELVDGSVSPCPGEPALSSWPMSIKAENPGMASPSPQPGMSESCKAEKQDVEQELVDGSVSPCPGEAAVSPQPLSRKAENPGMASPSPQPGMSGSGKAEKQDVEQQVVDGGVLAPCSGNPKQASKRRVWICGQSVVLSAEKQASSTQVGSQLGLEESVVLEWHGQEGLTWTQLVPILRDLAAQGQAPDVLMVHLGENDLACHSGAQLSCTIKQELVLVKELFPQVRILWSNVLLRRRGFGKAGSRTVNRARTMVNFEVGQFVSTLGGAVIEHPAILHTDPDFYIDGDNLSCRGLDIFLQDVKNGILAHLHS